jgi:hypothetical protein
MYNILTMNIEQSFTSLRDEMRSLPLRDLLFAIALHAAIRHTFHDEIYLVLIIKDSIETSDMFMN